VDNDKKDPITNKSDQFCHCLFVLPDHQALERLLVNNLSEATIKTFADALSEAGEKPLTLDAAEPNTWKDAAFGYLKNNKLRSRILADLTPLSEISPTLKNLLVHLNQAITNGLPELEYNLSDVPEPRPAEIS
jgi:hypothetical protein